MGSPEANPLGPFNYDSGVSVVLFWHTFLTRIPLWPTVVDQQHRELLWEEIIGLLKKMGHQGGGKKQPTSHFFFHYFLVPKWDGGLTSNLGPQGSKQIYSAPDSSKGTRGNKQKQLVCHFQGFLLPDTYLGMLLAVSDVSVRRPTNSESSPLTSPWPLCHSQGVWTQSWHPFFT